jgi:hypothetical protein
MCRRADAAPGVLARTNTFGPSQSLHGGCSVMFAGVSRRRSTSAASCGVNRGALERICAPALLLSARNANANPST